MVPRFPKELREMVKVYKGKCACCGSSSRSKNMNQRPQGCPIPKNFCLPLEFKTEVNHRICLACSRKHSKSLKPKPVKTKKTTPVIRRFKPRKVLTPDLDHALANRSESVKIKLLEMESALPAEIKVETSNFLAILLQGRCQRERYDGNLCEGKFELRSSKVNGKQVRIQLICKRCM